MVHDLSHPFFFSEVKRRIPPGEKHFNCSWNTRKGTLTNKNERIGQSGRQQEMANKNTKVAQEAKVFYNLDHSYLIGNHSLKNLKIIIWLFLSLYYFMKKILILNLEPI